MRKRLAAHLPAATFALAVIAGAGAMALAGAPAHYAPVNLAALAIALAIYAVAARRGLPPPSSFTLMLAPAALIATLLFGIEVAGVHRWLGQPTLALHTGMLLLPAFAVLAARRDDWTALAAGIVCTIALALQPDLGTAVAFLLAATVAAWHRRNRATIGIAAAAALAAIACVARPDPLGPVPFVEGVLQAALADGRPSAMLAAAALLLAIAVPLVRGGVEHRVAAAFLLGLALASLLGAYPTPLLGYGAASIIGYGLALALIEGRGRWHIRN